MPHELDSRLGSVREMLLADGYDLRADHDALRVVALEDACEDCLISKDMMRMVIAQALGDPDAAAYVQLIYPNES